MNKEEEKKILFSQREDERESFKDYFDDFCDEGYGPKVLSGITRDWVYMYQDRAAFETLREIKKSNDFENAHLLDVGSTFYAVLFFSSLFPTTYLEPRLDGQEKDVPFTLPFLRLSFVKGEAQDIPCNDNSFTLLTSLHALEHFGLGRYGDELDYYGDQKGLKEFNRVLKPGGQLILSVPASYDSRVEFNGQRVYSPDIIDDMLERAGFEISDRAYIVALGLNSRYDDNGEILEMMEPISRNPDTLKLLQGRHQQAAYMTFSRKVR